MSDSTTPSRLYNFTYRLKNDPNRPNVVRMPVLSPGSSIRDLSYMMDPSSASDGNMPQIPENGANGAIAERLHLPNGTSAATPSTQVSVAATTTQEPSPYQVVHERSLIRSDARHYWYSSRGASNLPHPPAPQPPLILRDNVVFVHWNYITEEHQFWWRDAGSQAQWIPLKFGDSRHFGGEAFFFSWNTTGDPSWLRHSTFAKKEKSRAGSRTHSN